MCAASVAQIRAGRRGEKREATEGKDDVKEEAKRPKTVCGGVVRMCGWLSSVVAYWSWRRDGLYDLLWEMDCVDVKLPIFLRRR